MSKLKVDNDLIRELADLLEETNLTEIEIEQDGQRIRLSRQAAAAFAAAAPAPVAAPVAAAAPAGGEDLSKHPGAVPSPMVGTVYHQAEPGNPPFAQVGDTIAAGQVICLVEAMKTFNEIKAPHGGTVKEILVPNQTPVEFGEVLMIIE